MKFLIVGRGSIAKKHKSILESCKHEVNLLYDFLKDSHLESDKYRIYEDKLSDFDGVIIANASHKHFEYTKIALENNKYIYLEKPPCLELNQLHELLEIESNLKKNVAVGFQLRFSNGVKLLKNYLDKNKNDKLLSFNIRVGQKLEDWRHGGINKTSYYANKNSGGGVIYELCHEIDLALWLFGNPDHIISRGANLSHNDMNIDDYLISIWEYKDSIGTVAMDMVDPTYTRYIEIIYSNYKLFWNIADDKLIKVTKDKKEVLYEDKSFERINLLEGALKNFTDNILSNVDWSGATLEQSLNLLKIVDNMHDE